MVRTTPLPLSSVASRSWRVSRSTLATLSGCTCTFLRKVCKALYTAASSRLQRSHILVCDILSLVTTSMPRPLTASCHIQVPRYSSSMQSRSDVGCSLCDSRLQGRSSVYFYVYYYLRPQIETINLVYLETFFFSASSCQRRVGVHTLSPDHPCLMSLMIFYGIHE